MTHETPLLVNEILHQQAMARVNLLLSRLDSIEEKIDLLLARKNKPVNKAGATAAYPSTFEALWSIYPKRNGSNPKKVAFQAYSARLKETKDPKILIEMRDGILRYAAWCDATHKTGTETVMQAARFFGPEREFFKDWAPPIETAEHLPQGNGAELLEFANERGLPGAHVGENWDQYRARLTKLMRDGE